MCCLETPVGCASMRLECRRKAEIIRRERYTISRLRSYLRRTGIASLRVSSRSAAAVPLERAAPLWAGLAATVPGRPVSFCGPQRCRAGLLLEPPGEFRFVHHDGLECHVRVADSAVLGAGPAK